MGDVIQLFKQEPDPTVPFDVVDLLDPDLASDLHEVQTLIEELWQATSERDLLDRFGEVKDKVAHWPGQSSG